MSLALRIAVCCEAWYFFGFLYEELVDLPNLLGSRAQEAQALWNPYHWTSNPAYYYAIVGLAGLPCAITLWRSRSHLRQQDRARLKTARWATLALLLLTDVAVTQLNNTLYFGPPMADRHESAPTPHCGPR
ncbi:hypothetical protein [Streptomyces virginiae]|uniref:hypothetical protein n=1 Tax=Streptomyces virginiae TaxID=1961 RepID=UPI0034243BBE